MVLKHEHVVWPGLCAHCSSVVCQTDLQSVCADVEVNQLRLEGESQVNLGSADLQLNVLFTSESRPPSREKWRILCRTTWVLCLMIESDSRTESLYRFGQNRRKLLFHFLWFEPPTQRGLDQLTERRWIMKVIKRREKSRKWIVLEKKRVGRETQAAAKWVPSSLSGTNAKTFVVQK